jgi:DeoR family ulaG and ulaABCDEF operon transcriptional repressor
MRARQPRRHSTGVVVLERERHNLLLRLVEERSIVRVAELIDLLGASEATVRRDINQLAQRNVIRRFRGGVEAVQPRRQAHLAGVPFTTSQNLHAPQKRAIARAAASLVSPGESIIINGGTTTFALAEFLVDSDLDILTNSFPIAVELVAKSRNRITLPGGTLFREQSIVLSPFQNDSIDNFWGRKLFTGCYGLSPRGLMEADPLIVQAQIKLLQRAEQVIVLADSSKLRRQSSMVVTELSRLTVLVTDDGARSEELEPFAAANVKIVVSPVTSADMSLQAPRHAGNGR